MALPANLLPDEASPEWMNKADNAWQLTAATLVGLQSIPGLVILYGSMVKGKWAMNSAFMAFYSFAAVLVCWVGWGYRMSFGERLAPFLGKPGVALDEGYLLGQAFLGLFPMATMVFFQGMFAAIKLILVAGALLGRMNFRAWMRVPLGLLLMQINLKQAYSFIIPVKITIYWSKDASRAKWKACRARSRTLEGRMIRKQNYSLKQYHIILMLVVLDQVQKNVYLTTFC